MSSGTSPLARLLSPAAVWPIAYAAFALLAFGLLVANLDAGVWGDELWTLRHANPNLPYFENYETWGRFDAHPPFYAVLIRLWSFAFPFSAISIRIFGIAALAASLAFCVLTARPEDRHAMLRFAVLCASSYFVIYYTLEIRSYMLLGSISCCAAACVHELARHRDPSPRRERMKKLLALFLFVLALLHLWGILFAFAIAAAAPLYLSPRTDRNFYVYAFCALALASPFYLLIAYYVFSGTALGSVIGSFVKSDNIGLVLIGNMFDDLFTRLFWTQRSKIIFIAALALAAVMLDKGKARFVRDVLMPILVTVALVGVLSLFLGSLYRSYAMIVFVPFIFLAVTELLTADRTRQWLSLALFVAFVAANFGSVPIFQGIPKKPDFIAITDGKVSSNPRTDTD